MIEQYKKIYETNKYYGRSSEMYLSYLLRHIFDNNKQDEINTVFDYGCGQSRLADWTGKILNARIYKYDPAIKKYSKLPCNKNRFDLVICTDVLEHIPISAINYTLSYLNKVAHKYVFFVISTVKAKTVLPNGENAHCTILSKDEWNKILLKYFNNILIYKPLTNDNRVTFVNW